MSTQTNTTTTNSTPTSEGANTMTNSTSTLPKVKSSNPDLYAEHTFHMQKAKNYTYNYVVIDEVLVEMWSEMTTNEIAKAMNEYPERIKYRIDVLKTLGFIKAKRTRRTNAQIAIQEQINSLKDMRTNIKVDDMTCTYIDRAITELNNAYNETA